MSYPLTLQPLVIEDEDNVKDAYQIIFEAISQRTRKPSSLQDRGAVLRILL